VLFWSEIDKKYGTKKKLGSASAECGGSAEQAIRVLALFRVEETSCGLVRGKPNRLPKRRELRLFVRHAREESSTSSLGGGVFPVSCPFERWGVEIGFVVR